MNAARLDTARPTAPERLLEAALPARAILAASDRELPHVSNRVDCWNLSVGFEGADYIIFKKIDPISPETAAASIDPAALASGDPDAADAIISWAPERPFINQRVTAAPTGSTTSATSSCAAPSCGSISASR